MLVEQIGASLLEFMCIIVWGECISRVGVETWKGSWAIKGGRFISWFEAKHFLGIFAKLNAVGIQRLKYSRKSRIINEFSSEEQFPAKNLLKCSDISGISSISIFLPEFLCKIYLINCSAKVSADLKASDEKYCPFQPFLPFQGNFPSPRLICISKVPRNASLTI